MPESLAVSVDHQRLAIARDGDQVELRTLLDIDRKHLPTTAPQTPKLGLLVIRKALQDKHWPLRLLGLQAIPQLGRKPARRRDAKLAGVGTGARHDIQNVPGTRLVQLGVLWCLREPILNLKNCIVDFIFRDVRLLIKVIEVR